jgi:hypothetical protein
MASIFQEVSDALDGSGTFKKGGALIQYPSETDDQFEKRKEVAWYVNDIRPACMRFVGYLSKRQPLRQTENASLQAVFDDADWRGNSIDIFLQSFMVEAKARGTMLVLVDMPAQDQLAERPVPYLSMIKPERVTEYVMNERGGFDSVTFTDTEDGKQIFITWDRDNWLITDGKDTIRQGNHGLGICPVLVFTESGYYPCEGEFSGLVALSKRLMNLRSELDEILRRHTFPIFSAQFPMLSPVGDELPESLQARQVALIKSLTDAVASLGKERGIVTPSPVSFVAPPDGPATTYQSVIKDIEQKVKEIGFDTAQTGEKSAESGLALTIRFQALNASLSAFAMRMEDFERSVFYVAGLWLGIDATTALAVQWSRDYQIADVATELATLDAMTASGFSREVLDEQMRSVIQILFANRSPETLDALLESVASMEQDLGTGDEL